MLEQALKVVEMLIQGSWRRVFSFVLLVAGVVVTLAVFEWYTSYFTIGRIQRTSAVLATLPATAAAGTPEARIRQELVRQLEATTFVRRVNVTVGPVDVVLSGRTVLKFLAGATPWILLGLMTVPSVRRRQESLWASVMVMVVFGFAFGALGTLLPDLPWLNFVIYPTAHPVLIAAFIIVLAFRYGKTKPSEAAPDV